MSERYIEIRLIEATPVIKVGDAIMQTREDVPKDKLNELEYGYVVKRPCGKTHWFKEDEFNANHIFVDSDDIQEKNSNGTCQGAENEFIAETNHRKMADRTLVVWARLQNGEELVETYAWPTPEEYDEREGLTICMGRIKKRVAELLGFLLQTAVSLSNWEAKCALAEDSDGGCRAEAPETGEHMPTEHLTFGQALEAAKRGEKIQREGWNGKGQYVQLANCISYRAPSGEVVNVEHQNIGSCALAFVGTSGVQMGWLASQADMLASDWRVVQ